MARAKLEALGSLLFFGCCLTLVEGRRPTAGGARVAANSGLSTGAIVGIVIVSVIGPPLIYYSLVGCYKACLKERNPYPAFIGSHSVVDINGKVIDSSVPVGVKALPVGQK